MIDKRLRSEIAQRKLIISAADLLHFDSFTRLIKSGSNCRMQPWGTYKLLRGYPATLGLRPRYAKNALSAENQQLAVGN